MPLTWKVASSISGETELLHPIYYSTVYNLSCVQFRFMVFVLFAYSLLFLSFACCCVSLFCYQRSQNSFVYDILK